MTKRWTEEDPDSYAELWDFLVLKFGLGDWDESIPYYKYRMNEIAKLKRVMAKRGTTVQQLVLCARYCEQHRVPIKHMFKLFDYYQPARREQREQLVTALARAIEQAISQEREHPRDDSDYWIGRLVRAQGDARQEVLAEWRETRIGLRM